MPIDPRELEPFAQRDPYIGDWPCRRCGYNLKGLQRGCKCPECGFSAARSGNVLAARDNLLYAPLPYLKLLQLGAMLMAAAVLATAFLVIGRLFAAPEQITVPVRLLAAGAWITGVWILTAPRQVSDRTPANPLEERKYLRWINRATQTCWLLAAILVMTAGGPGPLLTVSELLAMIGLMGLVPLAVQIADLAEWGADSGLAARLRGSAWGLTIFGAFVYAGTYAPRLLGPFGFFLLVPMLISSILWLISLLAIGYSVLQFASMTKWAIINSNHLAARDERIRERSQRDARRASQGAYRDTAGVRLERENTGGACPACDYDLDGLPPGAACPECGHQLSASPVAPPPPPQARPAWLQDDSPIELAPEDPPKR